MPLAETALPFLSQSNAFSVQHQTGVPVPWFHFMTSSR